MSVERGVITDQEQQIQSYIFWNRNLICYWQYVMCAGASQRSYTYTLHLLLVLYRSFCTSHIYTHTHTPDEPYHGNHKQ